MSDAARERLREHFRNVSATEGRGYAPLYEALGARIADDDWMLALLEAAPAPNRRPIQLFAAVHDLVLDDPSTPLAQWYGSVAGERRRTDDAWPTFAAYCRAHEAALRETIALRTVQTNEIGRSAVLYPLLQSIAARVARPLLLVDVGASAGLNLYADRYAYRYAPGGERGARDATVRIDAQVRGTRPTPPDSGRPAIAARIGIDREPIDVADGRATRWLRACVFADNVERARRLDAALALARAEPPRMLSGEPHERLAEAFATADASDAYPVVFHTWVTTYMTPEERRAFHDSLQSLGARRDCTWIAGEMLRAIPGAPRPRDADAPPLDDPVASPTVFLRTDHAQGHATSRFVARSHPHGAWIEWLDVACA